MDLLFDLRYRATRLLRDRRGFSGTHLRVTCVQALADVEEALADINAGVGDRKSKISIAKLSLGVARQAQQRG
eukprot:3435681-Rhodomonas_salina.1